MTDIVYHPTAMATPRCPNCPGTTFEMQELEVRDSRFLHNAIVCSSCGTIVSVMEFFNIGHRVGSLAQKLRIHLDDD